MKTTRGVCQSHRARGTRGDHTGAVTRPRPAFPRDNFGWTTRKLREDARVRYGRDARRMAEGYAHGKKTGGKPRNTAAGTFVPEHRRRRPSLADLLGGGR